MAFALPQQLKSAALPAPIGGLNTIAAGAAMPPSDCIVLWNMVPAEFGLRTRYGYRDYAINLDGGTAVRSILPFNGSIGSEDRLFCCTATGIYDITVGTAPVKVVTFPSANDLSGYGIHTVAVNPAGGHFLLYCDETNGYYTYSEKLHSWTKVISAATTAWAKNTAYVAGPTPSRIVSGGLTYECITGGTSENADGKGPATSADPTAADIVDGTVHWKWMPAIGNVDPNNLAFVTVWKHMVWFVERGSANAWFLPIFSLYGNASKFAFGNKFQAGGDLRGLYSWTFDGATGPDDRLVAVSGAGDVTVYAGTDPNVLGGFENRGTWFVGAVPPGRRIATRTGGDLLLLTALGLLPLSKLTSGTVLQLDTYETHKVANIFNQAYETARNELGWGVRLFPQDATIIVSIPSGLGDGATYQLVMSTITRSWSKYRDIPSGPCAEAFQGILYFGTPDGRVLQNTGYLDGVKQDGSGGTGIDFSLITGFQDLGTPAHKRIQLVRATFMSEGAPPLYTVNARYRWDLTEGALADAFAFKAGDPVFDFAQFDVSKFGGDFSSQQLIFGTTGMGPEFALAVRGKATARMTLVGFHLLYDEGGFL